MCASSAALAQAERQSTEPPYPSGEQGDGETEEVVIEGQRPRGSVIGDIKPELELGFPDIRAYGVSSIAELVAELAPQTNAAAGPPVVLLNGQRIPSFAEIQDIPAEAISRVEILPEEVGLAYGYPANQKVINIVLRPRYRTVASELRASRASEGDAGQVGVGAFRVREDSRINLNARYYASNRLVESARDRPRTAADGSRIASSTLADNNDDNGSLNSSKERLSLTGSVGRPVVENANATVSANYEREESEGFRGVDDDTPSNPKDASPAALSSGVIGNAAQHVTSEKGHVGIALNGALNPWQWSFNGAYDASTIRRLTELASELGDPSQPTFDTADRSRTSTSALAADLLFSGPLFRLPAGTATSSVKLGASSTNVETDLMIQGMSASGEYSRDVASGQGSIDLPLIGRENGIVGWFGDLAVNGNAAVEHLSDGGTLTAFGYGLRWEPLPRLSVILSRSRQESAPAIQQISDPAILIPNVPVFDYARGETVFASQASGGNPGLRPGERDATRVGLVIQPLEETDLRLLVNYTDIRLDDPVYVFTVPTPTIEEAFPDRFLRDQEGDLAWVDGRPINIAGSRSSRVRWGVHLSVPLKTSRQRRVEDWVAGGARPEDRPAGLDGIMIRRGPGAEVPTGQSERDGAPPMGDPHGDMGPRMTFRGGPGMSGRRGPPGQGRLHFGLFHTWHLVEKLDLGPSLPTLDLLDGDAVGSTGGQPRHEVEAQLGYFSDGLGARLSANWQSATRVEDGLGDGATLKFDDLATVNLRLFANLGQMPGLARRLPFLRGARISASVDNLFDARQSVRDEAGGAPIDYRPVYLDQLGRTFRLSLRKIF
ncbi:TonB-dependent receptor [Sphingosinicella sp. CPCC 101087]|uniref:TonB-dependent receptor n=1 Tax=Sphingosinicella sp. CPCC 101087 TaxID=2497754 RepID=UPI00101BF76A|nr:TonB-dependent receptor [Sphingosinicella sp. CPCC 101087]